MNEDGLFYKLLAAPVIAAFFAWLGLRTVRNKKQNDVDNALSDGTIGILDRYRRERDEERARADLAYAERNKAYEEIGTLRGRLSELTRHIERLEKQIAEYQQRVEQLISGRRE